MIRQVRTLLLSLLVLFVLAGGARAAEHEGYIIRLEPRLSLFALRQELPEGMEEISGDQNLYRTVDESLIAELEEAGLLVYAEPDYPVYLLDVEEPVPEEPGLTEDPASEESVSEDPVLPDDPALADGRQWNLTAIGMEAVWQRGLTGAGTDGTPVRIGIIDSGLYAEHEELLDANILQGVNLLAEKGTDERNDTSDAVGHGTFIAGIIAAATDNGLGMAGIAPGAEILPLKSFASSKGSVSDVVEAIYAGVDAGCQILNMSFGVEEQYAGQALEEAVAYAAEQGVVIVAAVGNNSRGGTDDDTLLYPAAYEEVIGVGSVDRENEISYFSHRNRSVTLVAPGENLYSLNKTGPNGYKTGGGTSFSAPEVAAAAALALAVDPDLTAEAFGALLRASAEDLGEPGYDTVYGYGLLNLPALLELLESGDYTLLSAGGDSLVIRAEGLAAGGRMQAVRVEYDGSGAQVSLLTLTLTVGEDGTLKGTVALPARTEGRVSLMLVDENWRPVTGCWSSAAEETEPPEPPPEATAERD